MMNMASKQMNLIRLFAAIFLVGSILGCVSDPKSVCTLNISADEVANAEDTLRRFLQTDANKNGAFLSRNQRMGAQKCGQSVQLVYEPKQPNNNPDLAVVGGRTIYEVDLATNSVILVSITD